MVRQFLENNFGKKAKIRYFGPNVEPIRLAGVAPDCAAGFDCWLFAGDPR
jgi:hypothetical protein